MEILERFQSYIQYIKNAGSGATPENFIEDFEPVGRMVLDEMKEKLLVDVVGGVIVILPSGQLR